MGTKFVKLSTQVATHARVVKYNPKYDFNSEQTVLLENYLQEIENNLKDYMHPIGSIYISRSSTNPGTLFGGTWQSFSPGRTLIGCGSAENVDYGVGYSVEQQGGELTHQLTIDEMPAHNHPTAGNGTNAYKGTGTYDVGGGSTASGSYTSYNGGNGAHNNVQPYQIVYMWKRTA